jgi:Mitochondrial carrier protein
VRSLRNKNYWIACTFELQYSSSFYVVVMSFCRDRVRTLLMTNGQQCGGSMATCLKTIWKQDGIRGIYAGLTPRVLYIGKICLCLKLERMKTSSGVLIRSHPNSSSTFCGHILHRVRIYASKYQTLVENVSKV